jgi:hypothetical protein
MRWLVGFAALGLSVAHADDDPKAAEATALFERGRELVRAGDHAEACPLFEQSHALVPALGTELNLALCWREIGRLVDAERALLVVIPKIIEAGQSQREAIAREALAALQARLPHVVIDFGPLPATTLVEIDGAIVDTSEPVSVDPGEHTITAEGALPQTIIAVEGQVSEAVLVAAPAAAPLIDNSERRTLWILGGATGAFALAGTITGIAVFRVKSAGIDHCVDPGEGDLVCDDRGLELLDRARTLSHVSTGLFVASAALGAATVVMYLRAKKKPAAATSAWITPSSIGVAWGRSW